MKEKVIKVVKKFVKTHNKLCRIIGAILVIVITAFVLTKCLKKEKISEFAGNAYNNGTAFQKGKWIYYIATNDNKMVGINKTNGKKTVKISEEKFEYINIVDNYIYCLKIEEESQKYNLIRMNLNGKNEEILAADIEENQIMVTDKWIFYHKSNFLYRANLDGTNREKISEQDIKYYQIIGNKIYYIYKKDSLSYIAKMDLNGEKEEKIAKAELAEEYEALYVNNGKIYYITSKLKDNKEYEYYLYKMNTTGGKITKICFIDTNIQDIVMKHEGIYYTTTEDYTTYQIKFINYKGSKRETIQTSSSIVMINVVDDWIVYFEIDEGDNLQGKMLKINGKEEKSL